jgi:hypothetical protein
MSIIAHLRFLLPDQIAEFGAEPARAYHFILGDEHRAALETNREMTAWKIRNAVALARTILAGNPQKMDPAARAGFEQAHREFTEIAHRKIHEAMTAFQQGKKPRRKPTGISLEKSWHGIHFLLTDRVEGGEPPLAWAVLGDAPLADPEQLMPHGPARMLTPEQVRQISEALMRVTQHGLRARFDPLAMEQAGVYAVRGDIEFEYFWAYVINLKGYYARASKFRRGMLCYLD